MSGNNGNDNGPHDQWGEIDAAKAAIREAEAVVFPWVRKELREGLIEKQPNPRTGSQQLGSDAELFQFLDIREEIVEPPINLKLWAAQLARNTRLNRGIRTIARNTVGMGFAIVPLTPFDDDTPQAIKDQFKEDSDRVKLFFETLNPDQPFETLMECIVIDEEATGNGYLEFTRTGDGTLDSAFHIPAVTVRILREERGFVQIRGGRKRFFKRFGDTRVMDARNGKFQTEEGFGRSSDTTIPGTIGAPGEQDSQEEGLLPASHRATEVLHFRLYHPMSDVYGLPRFISAGAAITGNWLAAKRNVVFFKNDAVPRMALLVTGGKLSKKSHDDLIGYLREGQGEEQAHRIIVLQVEEEGIGTDEKSTTRVELKPLTIGVSEDGSFLNYRTANDEEIREALGLSEVFFKSGRLTKASAVVAKATTDEQEFEPARKQKEHIINRRVVLGPQGLNAKNVMLNFSRPDTSDPLERARVDQLYSNMGAITPNEIRRKLGIDPFPAEQEWANWPLPVLLLALEGKVSDVTLIGRKPEETEPATQTPSPPDADDDEDEDDEDESEEPESDEDQTDGQERVCPGDPLSTTRSVGDRLRKLSAAPKLGRLGAENPV